MRKRRPRVPYRGLALTPGLTRIPPDRLVPYAVSSVHGSGLYPKEKVADGVDALDGSPSGWLTLPQPVSGLVGEYVRIAVGPMYWVALGDSITEGLFGHSCRGPSGPHSPPNTFAAYDNPFSAYTTHLQEMQGRYVLNRGIGGERADQMLTRLYEDVLRWKPDVCSVMAGTNDVNQGVALSTATANLDAVYARLVEDGTIPVLCTIPPFGPTVHARKPAVTALNEFVRGRAQEKGWPLADAYAALDDPANPGTMRPADCYPDFIHPNESGMTRIAEAFGSALALVPPAPKLAALGLSTGGAGFPGYVKPSRVGVNAMVPASQTFGVGISQGFSIYLPPTRQIDYVPLPKDAEWRYAAFQVSLDAFSGDQTLSRYSGFGEVKVYAKS